MTETAKKKPRGLDAFMPKILHNVIHPALTKVIAENGDFSSFTALHEAFRNSTGSTVSSSEFKKWLDELGITFEKSVTLKGV